MDHIGFAEQRHKTCAFNLYAAAMFTTALPALARARRDERSAQWAEQFGRRLHEAAIKHFWSERHRLFVDNLPWLRNGAGIRLHDRTLATTVLIDLCSGNDVSAAVKALSDCPPEMGFSYPANAGWRLWALGKAGRSDVILEDLRTRWARMKSVTLNNTISEDWQAQPDSGHQWSQCAIVPLYVLYMSLAGIRPLEPGFAKCEIRPQLASLRDLDLVAHTVRGPIHLISRGGLGHRELSIEVPPGCLADLVVSERERLPLDRAPALRPSADRGGVWTTPGLLRYRLPPGRRLDLVLQHS